MSSIPFVVGGIVLCLIFWLVAGAIVVRAGKWSSRREREMELHAPLLSTEHRLDAALREVEEGYNACDLCGFENFKRFHFCNVCGEEIQDEARMKKAAPPKRTAFKKLWKATKHGSVEILSRSSEPPRLTRSQRSRRQRRARQRKEWTRKLAGESSVEWVRDTSDKYEQRFPGLVVRFCDAAPEDDTIAIEVVVVESSRSSSNEAADITARDSERASSTSSVDGGSSNSRSSASGSSIEVAPTTRAPLLSREERILELGAAAALVRMAVLDFADSNAGELPVVAATDRTLQWRDVVSLATQVFPAKYAHFVTSTAGVSTPAEREVIKLNVTRDRLFDDSMYSLGVIPQSSIRSMMRINFVDEAGIDAGGLHREWFVLLNEQLVDPASGVFRCVGKEDQVFYLNAHAAYDLGEQNLLYNFAAGRLVGRALLDGYVLGFHLALPLLKIILGLPVSFSDLEFYDPEAFKSMQWLLQHDGVDTLGLDFSVTEQRSDGQVIVVDLVPNGRDIAVTDANKREYLDRKLRYLLFESVSSQLFVFLKGLYEVIPQELLMLFDPEEFDYLLCGSDEIDVDDWEKHTKYTANLHGHPAMRWFWEIVREMPNEYRRRLLHFATGSSRVPIAGFSALTSYDGRLCPFTLKGVILKDDGYIWSHACFNRLDLPLHVVRRELEAVMYASVETDLYGFTTD